MKELVSLNELVIPLRHQTSEFKLAYFEVDELTRYEPKIFKRYGLVNFLQELKSK